MRTALMLLLPSLAFVAPLAWAGAAHAGIGACGNIHVEAEAECEVFVGTACEAMCEPVSFEAQCAADLHIGCEGQCSASAQASCTGSCESDCQVECEAEPGRFDCRADCFAQGRASCEGRCADSECAASCEASLEAECSGHCDIDAPEVDCSGQCQASCQGSCEAEANVDCQIDCQSSGFVECQSELSGGCQVECERPEGALFCDSQYVDHGGNLEECIESLRAVLNIEVTGYAEGSCSNGSCQGEAGGSISCAVAPEGRGVLGMGALVLLMLGLGRVGRRR
jgi:hypothetical protein